VRQPENGEKTTPGPVPTLPPDVGSATVVSEPSRSLGGPGGDAQQPAELRPKSNGPSAGDTGNETDQSTVDPTALAQQPPGPKPQAPAPRKRLMRNSDGKLVVLDGLTANRDSIHTLDTQFDATLTQEIASRYRTMLQRTAGVPVEGSECVASIRVNLETAELEVLDVAGNVNERAKTLLRVAVAGCSGWLPIPPEMKRDGGKYHTTQVTLNF
jgi:hypothetical protein